jgi:PhzF family phenazine biosynthesis protein
MSVSFALVDAFTQQPFCGNAAGVITDAGGLHTDQMRHIARELGQTETCFVSATATPDTDFDLRWFTPKVEVDLCGHATVAAFVCLAEEGRVRWEGDRAQLRCTTRSGTIAVGLDRTADGSPVVTLSVGVASLDPAPDEPSAVARAIGLDASALDLSLPLTRDAGSARLIVPVAHLGDLLQLTPDGAGMIAYGESQGYRRFTLVCRETEDPQCFVHLRHFAPANGIPEDPVTGTAHAVAAVYLDRHGLLPSGERVTLTGEQGHAVGRHGIVTIDVLRRAGHISEVWIGGQGVIVARGTMLTPHSH